MMLRCHVCIALQMPHLHISHVVPPPYGIFVTHTHTHTEKKRERIYRARLWLYIRRICQALSMAFRLGIRGDRRGSTPDLSMTPIELSDY